jgi:FKBP-type peptidyl-prolyl cis-trans isomerase SlpA
MGMKAGDRNTFEVPPEKAFGQRNPNNVQMFKRHEFSADMVVEKGVMISFADARQSELPGVVSHVEGDRVEVDFNHPLAGRTLTFEVEIIDVEPVGAAH